MWIDEINDFPTVETIEFAANLNLNEYTWQAESYDYYRNEIEPHMNRHYRALRAAQERRDREFAHAVLGIHL